VLWNLRYAWGLFQFPPRPRCRQTSQKPLLGEGFLRRGIRAGFYRSSWPTVENLVQDADDELFSRVLNNENHVLHPLLPNRNEHGYERRRRHECTHTPTDDKRNFVYRQLHKYSY